MGTGGTPAVRSPTSRSCQLSAVSSRQLRAALTSGLMPSKLDRFPTSAATPQHELRADSRELRAYFKEHEDEASQLNRLGDYRLCSHDRYKSSAPSYQSCFSVIQVLTTSKHIAIPAQVRTGNWQLRTNNWFNAPSKSYGQAERAISTGKLHALLRFHILPINQVVYLGPS